MHGAIALFAPVCAATDGKQEEDVETRADDAFGSRMGTESIGLYSESLVRGFDLQQAGNYRLDEAYFVRAAAPPDTLVEGSRIRVGPNALDIGFPAPSGIVQYRLLPANRNRLRLEVGFQHLLDNQPRPYLRAHFAHRPDDGALSWAGGVIGSPSARYMFGNEARYHSAGVVPRLALGEDWRATAFHGYYAQRYQADVGYLPAGARLPRPDRLVYPGQSWSRFDTRNTTQGVIVASTPRNNQWDYSLSAIHSRVDRPRSDFNVFSRVTPDGWADASVSVARNRTVHARAYETLAERDWIRPGHQDRLSLLARLRRSDHVGPQVDRWTLGRVWLYGDVPSLEEPAFPERPRTRTRVDQQELGMGWQRQWRGGASLTAALRRTALEEIAVAATGTRREHASRAWLYNAAAVLPLSGRTTAFASFVRGIEEAGVAPQHAANAFEVLPPALAKQTEIGVKWQPDARTTLIGTVFGISKPEPGFDDEDRYRYLSQVSHRGLEVSFGAEPAPGLRALLGASWMRARLEGDAVDAGRIGTRPVGRAERLILVSAEYRPPRHADWSFDVDATYTGSRPADPFDRFRTAGYTVVNVGVRYRFRVGGLGAMVRLRVYNAGDVYGWLADSGGMQSHEPARRVMLSLSLGE